MEVVGNLTFYRKVFDFFAKQNKIKKEDLESIFKLVELNPTQEEMDKYTQLVFDYRNYASFQDFLQLFRLKCDTQEYSREEILKGLLLLCDSEKKLQVSRVQEIIQAQVKDEEERRFLLSHIHHFTDSEGFVDYQAFVESSF